MKHGSLFSGIGGFDLAAEWMRWENVFHCEWNEFGQKVLKHYWPEAITYEDITKTDFTVHQGQIDILTGGFPCQPYSQAGKRLGKEDERHLWPEMLRAIREIQPRWVVGENVRGLVNWNGGLVFDEVQAELEAQGYEVQPFILPACGVNAPHRRDRVWFVAKYTMRKSTGRNRPQKSKRNGMDLEGNGLVQVRRKQGSNNSKPPSKDATKAACERTSPNTDIGKRCKRGMHQAEREKTERHVSPFGSRKIGNAWQDFPTQSPICGRNDGLSTELDGITFPKWRNESIKAYGNAVVPQVVYQIFKAIEQYEHLNQKSDERDA